jgi:two-component sensor histidine kinase
MQALVGAMVGAHGGAKRIAAAGPHAPLSPKAALALSLALHELATNATKYGALSVPEGRVALTWSREALEGAETLALTWVEHDGPPVVPPARKGFGLRLLERGLRQELGGAVTVEFLPAGVRCSLRMPLAGSGEREP